MPLIERYILRRTLNVFFLTLGALIGTLWLTQVLRQIDVVTADGQAIWIFLVMTVLALPALAQTIAPIAFLAATIVTLNSLTADGELPVISAAGASRKAVWRPILALAGMVMLALVLSHHLLAPASLAALRAVITKVRADVIASLVQDGGFRGVGDGLTLHIREKTADGSFRGIFVSDQRDANESLQYTAAKGLLIERDGGSFLVLQDGDLIRESHTANENSVVGFQTYALDLSQVGTPNAAALYKARERSTVYLLEPQAGDEFSQRFPQRVAAELHDRITAPLYVLAFACLALGMLARPRTNRQDRSLAIAIVVLACVLLRGAGFAALAVARNQAAAVPFLYLLPLAAIGLGLLASTRDTTLRAPAAVEALCERAARAVGVALRRVAPAFGLAGSDGR